MKICPQCLCELPATEFYANEYRACRQCISERNRDYYLRRIARKRADQLAERLAQQAITDRRAAIRIAKAQARQRRREEQARMEAEARAKRMAERAERRRQVEEAKIRERARLAAEREAAERRQRMARNRTILREMYADCVARLRPDLVPAFKAEVSARLRAMRAYGVVIGRDDVASLLHDTFEFLTQEPDPLAALAALHGRGQVESRNRSITHIVGIELAAHYGAD